MSTGSPTMPPSLLDRLVDACCGVPDPRPTGLGSLVNDIEDLLNTCSVPRDDRLDGCPEAAASLLTYGSPAPASLCIGTLTERKQTAARIQATLERFEPRLRDVRVRMLEPNAASLEGRFSIRASLAADPTRAFSLAVRVRNSSGRAHVTTERK